MIQHLQSTEESLRKYEEKPYYPISVYFKKEAIITCETFVKIAWIASLRSQ